MLGRTICRSRLPASRLQRFTQVRMVSGGEKLSVQQLRQQLAFLLKKAPREELESLYAAASFIPKMPGSLSSPRVEIEEEMGSPVALKPAKPCPYATGCFATKDFLKDDVIIEITGKISDQDTFESLQINEGSHLQMMKPAVFLNHSCQPNGYIDFEGGFQYRAERDIKMGEQLTWNYNTTEWKIERPFACLCSKCKGKTVKGFKYLTTEEQASMISKCSPYIKDLAHVRAASGDISEDGFPASLNMP